MTQGSVGLTVPMQVERGEIKHKNADSVTVETVWGFSKSQQVVGGGYAPQSGNLGETI